jgi:hypothetical protein
MGLFFYARVWYRTFLSYHFENGITVPKNHVDRAHTVGAGLRPGTAALNTLGGLRQVFGDSDHPINSDDGDEDPDLKELRRQERAVKEGINLVM